MKEYKRSYSELIYLSLGLFACLFLLPYIPGMTAKTATLALFLLADLFITLLILIIYKTEKIYWFTGIEFEKAKSLDSSVRKKYALDHLKEFSLFTLAYLIYAFVSYFLNLNLWADIAVEIVLLIISMIFASRIKLPGKE